MQKEFVFKSLEQEMPRFPPGALLHTLASTAVSKVRPDPAGAGLDVPSHSGSRETCFTGCLFATAKVRTKI